MEGLLCCFLVAKIALENLRTTREQLAWLAIRLGFIQILRIGNAYLGIWEWEPHIARAILSVHWVAN